MAEPGRASPSQACMFPPLPCDSGPAKWGAHGPGAHGQGARGLGSLWLGGPVTQAVWELAPELGLQKRPKSTYGDLTNS